MRQIDRYSIENLKIPGIVLMENAALKVIKNIDFDHFDSFTVVCGKGNNGGDGFAVARHLLSMGKIVDVFIVGFEGTMSNDCKINYEILKNIGINIYNINNMEDILAIRDSIEKSQMTIDAIFGTGLKRNIEGIYDQVISIINENSSYILSIDIPSGFESNTGKCLGNCIKASKTISFQCYKSGFLNYNTDKYTGKIIIEDIGIPDSVVDKFHKGEFIMDRAMIKNNIAIRNKYAHKGDYGRVLMVSGSKGYTGAAYIATQGAVRSGAGLVTLCCHKDIQDILSCKLVEAMTISFNDGEKLLELFKSSTAVAIGPGMGNNSVTFQLVTNVIKNVCCPVVIDADGLNVLKDNTQLLIESKAPIILTPHIGEMARLTGLDCEYILENRIQVSKEFAKEHKVIVLLKGYNTIITDGEKVIINPTGNSSMASGGMGDCLTGMITGFLAQGYAPMEAAAIATYIHGYCGEKLSKKMYCVNATHILEEIPYSIKELQNN